MKNMLHALIGLVFLLSASHAYTGAWEVDIERCTGTSADIIAYCDGYCELQTMDECDYSSHVVTRVGVIDECVCTCGVGQYEVSYYDVECGQDLNRYAQPLGTGDYSGSACCFPVFALLCVLALSVSRA